MKELIVDAIAQNLPKVLAFVDKKLESAGCDIIQQTQIDVAVEELFVNIANYAYAPEIGTATVQISVTDEPLTIEITFIDNGMQYDPLAKPDPDTSPKSIKRKKGGLGIFIVKKSMDDVKYEYKDGKNILTIKKELA